MLQFEKHKNTAIIVIDMQNDFILPDAILSVEGGIEIVSNIDKLLKAARLKGVPIIFTKEIHRPDLSDFGIEGSFEPPHCLEGTLGAEIIKELIPQEGDYIITNKRRYDAFLGTDLDLLLRNLNVKNLIFTGVCTDICVISTIYHARNLDYKVCLVSDCTAGTTKERYFASFKVIEHCFARILNLAETFETFDLKTVSF